MAQLDGTIRIGTKIDTGGIKDGQGKLLSALSKLGKAVAVGFSLKKVFDIGKEAVGLASDVTEVQNVVETAFGGMTSQVDEWAKKSIQNFGMSGLAAKRTASTYMAMSSGMGLYGEKAADMAMKAAERTADIASFYNTTQEEADTMLKSIWTGETESLKRIGVVMTQTNLDNFALANGFGKTTAAMTQAERVQLQYAYVMKQTDLAAGDFLKTQDSWANQTRILSEQWKAFLSEMGKGIITVLAPAVKVLNQLLSIMIGWAQTFSAVVSGVFGKQQQATAQATSGASSAASAINSEAEAQGNLAKATKKAAGQLAAFDKMNVLASNSSNSASGGSSAPSVSVPEFSGEIGAGVTVSEDVQKTIDSFRNILSRLQEVAQPTIDALGRLWDNFKPFAANVGEGLKWFWDNVLVPFGSWTLSKAVPAFLDLLSGAFKVLNELLDAFKPLGKWLWEKFLQPIASWTGGVIVSVLDGIAKTLSDLGGWIGNHGEETVAIIAGIGGAFATWKVSNILNDIKELCGDEGFGALGTAIRIISEDHFPKLTGAFDKIKGFGSKLGKGIQTFLSSKFALITLAIGALITIIVLCVQHWDEIKQAAIDVWNAIVGAWSAAGAWFDENVIQPIVGFFKGLWSNITDGAKQVWAGIKDVFSSVGSWFHDIFSDAWAGIVSVFSKGGKIFNGIKDGISSAFKTALNFIFKGLNKVISAPLDFLNGILNKIRSLSFLGISPFKNLWKENPIYVPQIPLLAQGAVIPPNRQFVAALGDQKHGNNLEAPESLIRKIVREETSNKGTQITIRASGEMAPMIRTLKFELDKETKRQGNKLVNI